MPPEVFLNPLDPSGVTTYLEQRGLIPRGAETAVTIAGEGNMNCVLRVAAGDRSVIVKQARPWVEKYPSIAAPVERAAFEARFFALTAADPVLASLHPALLAFDPAHAILILEDLSPVTAGSEAYRGAWQFTAEDLLALGRYLKVLHALPVPATDRPALRNTDMRALNHEHIFDLPLRPDGGLGTFLADRTPGLEAVAETLCRDAELVAITQTLGRRYLAPDGPALIHGDFFPGSLLRQTNGWWRVIDPEFGFCGDPEFDYGVFLAHLHLTGHPDELCRGWLDAAAGDAGLVGRYAGVEIIRRLIGVAQLPVTLSLAEKSALLDRARAMVVA